MWFDLSIEGLERGLKEKLETILPKERILTEEPMSRHTTFRVGGPAEYFLTVNTAEELRSVMACLREEGMPYFLLGNGSNLLVGDRGYRGAVVRLGGIFETVEAQDGTIRAGAGASLALTARRAMENGLCGMEFASGIPGTLGGAVRMNAGAYGGEMSMLVRSVDIMDEQGNVRTLDHKEMAFGYRTSVIKSSPWTVLGASLVLEKGDREEIAAQMQRLAQQRREKQPLEFPSAGSTFKRPEGNFAGKLIMDAGLRGYSRGGAQVAQKHCGFIVNKGNATAADIVGLIREVAEKVQEKFGVTLEPEVIFLGDF